MRQSFCNIMETGREHQTSPEIAEQKRMKSQKVCDFSHFLLVQKKTPSLIFLQLCLLSKFPNHHSIVNAGGVDVPKRMLSKYKL